MLTHRLAALFFAFLLVGGPVFLIAWLVRLNFPRVVRPRETDPGEGPTP